MRTLHLSFHLSFHLVVVLTVMATLCGQSSRSEAAELLKAVQPVVQTASSPIDMILESRKQADVQQFLLECTLFKNEYSLIKGKKKTVVVADTRIAFTENQPANITSNTQTPFVTGATLITNPKSSISARQPIVTVLDTGYAIETKIAPLDDEHVQLDIRIELQKIDDVETNTWKGFSTQAPSLTCISRRVVRTVKLGEIQTTIIPSVGKEKPMTFTYTIKKVEGSPNISFTPKQAITPRK